MSFDGNYTSTDSPKKASLLPVIAAISTIILSLAIYVLFPHDGLTMSIIGWLLTPILSSLTLAWGQSLDVMGRRDVWYSPNSTLLKILKILAIVAFLFGLLHMWDIANIISAAVA